MMIHEAELNKSCVNHHQQNCNTCSPQMSHTSLHTLVYMLCIFNTSEAISLHPATSCSFREATQVRLGWTCVVASVLQDETHWIPCLCQPQSLWSRQAVWGPNSAAQNQIHSPTASTSHPGEEAQTAQSKYFNKIQPQQMCIFAVLTCYFFQSHSHDLFISRVQCVKRHKTRHCFNKTHLWPFYSMTTLFFNVDVEWSSWRTAHDR